MQVLVVSHLYPSPQQEYSGIFVKEQVKAMRSLGIDARVVTWEEIWITPRKPIQGMLKIINYLKYSINNNNWVIEDTVPVFRFECLLIARLSNKLLSVFYSHALRRILKKIISSFRFELIHAHTILLDGSAAVDIKKIFKIPVIITEHTGPFSAHLKTSLMRRRVNYGIIGSDQLIAVSQFLRKEIIKQFPVISTNKILVFGNGVDTTVFHPRTRTKRSIIKILWVGSLYDVKQPLLMLEAISLVAKSGEYFILDMVGSGYLESIMREKISKLKLGGKVFLRGEFSRQRLSEYMADADFLVVSSEIETFSLVTAESLCCGTPVLTTPNGGAQELINHASLGRVVSKNTALSLAAGIKDMIIALPSFNREKIANEAKMKFSILNLAGLLIKLYKELRERKY